MQKPFAEIIESSLDKFLAQSWEWDKVPSFGSLVQVQDKEHTTLGAVADIQTGSMDPMRYPFPYKKTEEELKAEQPQIFEFLKTTFKVQIVGYINKEGSIYHVLPAKPSRIHNFVSNVPLDIAKKFFSKPDFLHLLFAFDNNLNLDELLLAILKQLNQHQMLTKERLNEFCKTFSLLTGNDYRRLKLFLKRAQTMVIS